jgi:hypothetical protein
MAGSFTDAISSGVVTPLEPNDLIYGIYFATGSQPVGTHGTGFVARTVDSVNGAQAQSMSEDLTQGAVGPIAATFTQGTTNTVAAFMMALQGVLVPGLVGRDNNVAVRQRVRVLNV